jgi:hypothetical protein
MEQTTSLRSIDRLPVEMNETPVRNESHSSGVSWAAVIGGAFVASALSLIMLALGAGLGLSSMSLWSNSGLSASTIGTGTILWLILTEIVAASMGGYLAGRLRTKWTNIHSDEVYFRDTAHGFLAWAVAVVVSAAFLGSAGAVMVGAAASGSMDHTQPQANNGATGNYFVDMLFRSNSARSDNGVSTQGEVARIFATSLERRELSPGDRAYLDQLIAARTGISSADADKRLSDVFTSAQQAADTARKAVAHSLMWAFLALLIGAFCASLAATIGGRQRDHVVVV